MAKRLTEIQKKQIIKDFIIGMTIDELSEKFVCSKLTIVRNLKKNIDAKKYEFLLKDNKSKKINSKILKNSDNKEIDNKSVNINQNDFSKNSQDRFNENQYSEIYPDSTFIEISPINCEINYEKQKDLSSTSISEMDFPEIVYMLVDNKIELTTKILREYPEWQFLSQNELNRKTIEIYFDLKIARRFCNKEQKVIKVPNTEVFRIVAPLLKSRGISRIVCPEKLVAL